MATAIALEDFITLFKGSVRAQLDWQSLATMQVQVTQQCATDWSVMAELRTVWHATSRGEAADWSSPDAHALTVAEAAAIRDRWPPERTTRVSYFREQLQSASPPWQLVVPTYRVANRILLLDATHRIMAGYLEDADYRVLLMTLEASRFSGILPDLKVVRSDE